MALIRFLANARSYPISGTQGTKLYTLIIPHGGWGLATARYGSHDYALRVSRLRTTPLTVAILPIAKLPSAGGMPTVSEARVRFWARWSGGLATVSMVACTQFLAQPAVFLECSRAVGKGAEL